MSVAEWVVISGKGGTGKTSIAAAIAECHTNCILADCDVDAANLRLLTEERSYRAYPFASGHWAKIDASKCTQCGLCASLCRFGAIAWEDGVYQISESACEGCKVCVDHCPSGAIDWLVARNGVWKESQTDLGKLFHARLRPGAENSGKLVAHVRKVAKNAAEQDAVPLVLIDGPPGIGCPVIASLTGVQLALVVTEPTPSGWHDMERVLELTRHFRVRTFVLINKADLSKEYVDKITQSAQLTNAEVIEQLPYSHLFMQAQWERTTLTMRFPDSAEAKELRRIVQVLNSKMSNNKTKESL